MKTVRLNKVGEFRCEEHPVPLLKNNEILIKVGACGICGSDIPRIYELGTRVYPVTLGHEFSGVVVDVADQKDKDLIGKKAAVFPLIPCGTCEMCDTGNYAQCVNYNYLGSRSDGGFAEFCVLPSKSHLVIAEDEDVSFEALSIVEPATVAQHALRKSGLSGGESVLIIGAGPIGMLVARWAEIFGASRIVLLDIQDEKIEFARERGLEVYNVKKVSVQQVIQNVMKVKKFDRVIEGTGTSSGLESAIHAVKTFGTIAMLGNPHADTRIHLNDHSSILRNEIHLVGIWNSYYCEFPLNEWQLTVKKLETKELKVEDLITHRTSLENLPKLTEQIYKREISICKAIYAASEV